MCQNKIAELDSLTCQRLRTNQTLTKLDLEYTHLRSGSVGILLDSLKINSTLKKLHIGGNMLDESILTTTLHFFESTQLESIRYGAIRESLGGISQHNTSEMIFASIANNKSLKSFNYESSANFSVNIGKIRDKDSLVCIPLQLFANLIVSNRFLQKITLSYSTLENTHL